MSDRVLVPQRGTVYVEITQGDTATILDVQLLGPPTDAFPDGVPQSLAGVLRVVFSMKRKLDASYVQIDDECAIVDVDAGRVTIRPNMGTRGLMLAQFRVVFVDESELSFPNGWDLRIRIRAGVNFVASQT